MDCTSRDQLAPIRLRGARIAAAIERVHGETEKLPVCNPKTAADLRIALGKECGHANDPNVGAKFQILRAYSPTARSAEKAPIADTFRMALAVQLSESAKRTSTASCAAM